jgi:predicted MFS family arabinose efflux permease
VSASADPALTDAERRRSPASSTSTVWYAISVLTVVNVFNYMDRMALSVLMPHIKADLHLTDTQLGLLVGFAFSLFYAVCTVPIARWADRGVRRDIIALAMAIWSVMTALSGAAQNFWQLLVARVGVGAGEAGCIPPSQSMICDYVPLERRPGIFAIHAFGASIGMMLGVSAAAWLGATIGWRWTFVALGLPGIAVAMIVRSTLPEPARGALDSPVSSNAAASFRETISFLWRCRSYRRVMVFAVGNGFLQYGMLQWWPSFYQRVFAIDASSMGLSLGMAIGVGTGAGVLIGGVLANKAAQRDARLPLLIAAAAVLLALPTAIGALLVPMASVSILLVGLLQFLLGATQAPAIATVYSVVIPSVRATAGSINLFFMSAIGFGLGPFCMGVLSDLLQPTFGAEALRYALLIPLCLLPLMVAALGMASRSVANDLKAVTAGPRVAIV